MFRLAEGVRLEDADGTFVFLKDNGDAAVLNPAGKLVVASLLDGDMNLCIANMVHGYGLPEEDARRDVMEFVEQLFELNLFEDSR